MPRRWMLWKRARSCVQVCLGATVRPPFVRLACRPHGPYTKYRCETVRPGAVRTRPSIPLARYVRRAALCAAASHERPFFVHGPARASGSAMAPCSGSGIRSAGSAGDGRRHEHSFSIPRPGPAAATAVGSIQARPVLAAALAHEARQRAGPRFTAQVRFCVRLSFRNSYVRGPTRNASRGPSTTSGRPVRCCGPTWPPMRPSWTQALPRIPRVGRRRRARAQRLHKRASAHARSMPATLPAGQPRRVRPRSRAAYKQTPCQHGRERFGEGPRLREAIEVAVVAIPLLRKNLRLWQEASSVFRNMAVGAPARHVRKSWSCSQLRDDATNHHEPGDAFGKHCGVEPLRRAVISAYRSC